MKSIIGLLLLLVLCFSCSKEEDNEYDPYIKGSIISYAMLTDQYGRLLDDHSGITVYTEPGRKYAGETDITGRFEIKNVPTGTYNLSFEKEGFGTMRSFEVHHLGGNPTLLGMPTKEFMYWYRVFLHEEISHQITNITVFQENRLRIDVQYFGTPNMDNVFVRLYFSASNGFDIEDAENTANNRFYETSAYFDDLPDLPFESGTTVYCRGRLFTRGSEGLYIGNGQILVNCVDNYYDETLGITVYPNITEESDQYAFIMP